ncbi:hypothetical protein [Chitinophaga solisilvae]|uniref:hypothetical protein n=1 Tax=Chitinophaga solisilvae TaxID=1233460 RepID=UPI00136E7956|nr:hypothetical protein [Chitinophaga solisilvae]
MALFGNVIYTLSCGPEPDPYDYYVSFFNPYPKGAGYEPFYYTSLSVFYDDPTPSEETANVADWQQFTGSKVTAKDIREYIYTYPVAVMSGVALNSSVPDSVRRNTFTKFLQDGGNQEAARYLLFAKTCEPAVVNADPWSVPERDITRMKALQQEGLELYSKTKNKDIRDRYAFQLIRLQHYMRQYREAIASFDEMFGKKTGSSLVYYKSLSLKAGALQHLRDTVQSAYLFSSVFEKAPSLRISSITSMRWGNAPASAVYALCKDNSEKANLAAIYGFNNSEPDMKPLKEAYDYDPSSPALSVLLGREINKLESSFLNETISPMTDSAGMAALVKLSPEMTTMANTRIKPMIRWMNTVIDKGKVRDIDMWKVSAAYLSYMCRDYAAARKALDNARVKDPESRDQWEVVNLLVNINEQKTIDKDFEDKLLSSFRWLDGKMGKLGADEWYTSSRTMFYNKVYRNLLLSILAPRYHQQGNLTKEALVRGRCDSLHLYGYQWYLDLSARDQVRNEMSSAELLKLNDFFLSSSKTPYENYLTGFFPKNIDINNTIGVSYLRVHDFQNARDWFKKTRSQEISYQVFQDQLQDFGYDTADARHPRSISQLQFCERMIQLQEKMKITPVPAKVFYDYATALFNISYYGKTWGFVKDHRPTYLWYTAASDRHPFEKQYFGCYAAESYYLKAAQAATDNEFRARCFFMAARCSQKHTPPSDDEQKYYSALVHNRYFPVLKSNYGQTQFYRSVYGQCSYLRDYVKSLKK